MLKAILLLVFLSIVSCAPTLALQPTSIRMAFVPSGETQAIMGNATKLTQLLEAKTGYAIEPTVPTSYAAVIEALGGNKVDVAWLAPLAYVLAHDKYGAEIALITVRFNSSTYQGAIITRADSGIRTLADLKGKRFAYVDAASTSGYLYPKLLIKNAGFDPDNFFGNAIFAGGHDKVVIAVYQGQVDGGAVFDDARALVSKAYSDVNNKVEIIAKTVPIPNDGVATRKGLSPEVRAKLVQALIDVSKTDEGKKILKDLYNIDGLASAKDGDYDSIRAVVAAFNVDLPK